MFSQDALNNINNCYMCWMCRHVCPIGLTSGRELHTPRGKGLLLKFATQNQEVLKETAEAMYACFLCKNCSAWCETGFDPTVFIRDARRELVAADCLPERIQAVVDRTMDSTLYGEKAMTGALKEAVDALPDQAPVLLVLGDAVVAHQPEIGLAAISLLKKAGMAFTVLKEEPTPAADLYDLIGELSNVQDRARDFADAVRESGCKTVVAMDPFTARILIQDYPRWGVELPPVRTATSYFAELLLQNKLTVRAKLDVPVTYHDSERLARDLEETEEPRQLVQAIAGPWKEIFLNRRNTRSCGNDVVASYHPEIVARTSRLRMDDAMRTGAKLLITASPSDKAILSRVSDNAIKVEDIFVLLDSCC